MSAASFIQRLGRSGRRSGISQMYFIHREADKKTSSIMNQLPWPLLKNIAIIQLYLEEKWSEGAAERPLPFSLLLHQTLSILASRGEHKPADLIEKALSLSPFIRVHEDDYRELLRHLIHLDILQTTEEGGFIIGLAGETIVNHYSFYSVFPDEDEYHVHFGGKELGKVNFIPPENSNLVLAGHYWKVINVDMRRKEIAVEPGNSGGERIWRGGASNLHSRIVSRMRQIVTEDTAYPYLSGSAAARLDSGRKQARESGLAESVFVPDNSVNDSNGTADTFRFFFIPWLGSRGTRTLLLILLGRKYSKTLGLVDVYRENEYCFHISSKLSVKAFAAELHTIIQTLESPESLISPERIPYTDKYDYLLPPSLLIKQYAANMLDVDELKQMQLN
jgi:ATP-dependent Lhr-like helicase